MCLRLCLLTFALLAVTLTAAAEDAKSGKVEVGQPAPDFVLEQTVPGEKDGKKMKLSDYFKGEKPKNVVLFFFPKAMTRGCTKQCKGFTALNADFAKIDTVPIGISVDDLDAQKKFTEKETLTIPLYADPEKDTARKYGVLNAERGFSNRVTFVIDKKGVVRKIMVVKDAEKNPAEVLEYVKENLAGK
jgi:thioredoxin-dependent peroxiredoxin